MTLRPFAILASLLLGVGLLAPAGAQAIPDPANPTALLDISKTVSPGTAGPGDVVTYTIQVGCSAISDVGCRDAITTDVVPEPLVIDSVIPSGPNQWATPPEVDGQDVTVSWVEPLGGGAVGMLDNQTSQITITTHVPEDVSYDFDGETVTNLATAEATNATDATASVDLILDIDLELETSATKEFDPDNSIAGPDTDVTATLTGSNDSNATVDTLVVQDPTDPAASPNPFTYLGFTGFGDIEAPPSATSTTCEVFVPPAWVPVPDCDFDASGIDPDLVRGTRVTFGDAIAPGETGTVDLDLVTTDLAASVTEDTPVTNNIESEVTLDGEDAQGSASDVFTVQANAVDVGATKEFDPELVVAGQPSSVTLTGSNESAFNIDSLTITEPSAGTFPAAYDLDGIGPITYPANATGATLTYQPGNRTVSVANGATPAEPTLGWGSVDSFSITFTGPIVPGAEATVPFDVATDPDFDAASPFSTIPNEIAVEGDNDGTTADATAEDDLLIYGEVINTYVDKTFRPTEIISNPGQVVTVSLDGGLTERPTDADPDDPNATTGRADQVVIQDPEDPVPGNDPFWNAFDLESIAQTPVPADATLTIQYYDTSTNTWVTLAPPGTVEGPAIVSQQVPPSVSDVAGGIRFTYDYSGDAGGFAPGTDFAPNFTSSLRDDGDGRYFDPAYDPDDPDTLTNCAQTDATSPTPDVPPDSTAMSDSTAGCPELDLTPAGTGAGDLMEKTFNTSSSGGDGSVIARSGDTIPSTLSWSTAGYSGYERMRLQDVVDETAPVATTMYDAFNLTRINQITADRDPYLTYDQITAVRLYNGTAWVDAQNDPCPEACDGTFPGMSLTAAEQESTLSVRIIYAESPTRGERSEGDLDAPPVGSGVARSPNDSRKVTLVWRVRDTHRSAPAVAALGEDSPAPASTYNTGTPGLVDNDASATGFPQGGGPPVVGTDDDQVLIIDVPISQTTEKDWLGGPVAVPSPGTPADQYPRSRLRIRTTNDTPAKVDQLQITDPAPGSTAAPNSDPFDYFNLVRIAAINVPSGATTTEVELTCADGSTRPTGAPGYYTRDQALALTTMPCQVVGVEVLFDGRIDSGANGAVALDLRLRQTNRTTGDEIEAGATVTNTARGIVADVDAIQDCPPAAGDRFACDDATAGIDIVAPTFGIVAGKSIDPASQFEGDDSPVVVTVSAQNTGSARPFYDEITDDDETFWNAMDFVGMDPSWSLPTPVEHVQACYLSGGTFTDGTVEDDTVGGDWECQDLPGGGPPFDPGELTLDEARAFIDDAAATEEIHGLRFRFMANDEVGFQNPSHPLIEVPFEVERREQLRSGGPVPTTRSDQAVAPGETDAGVFEDTVDVYGQSVLVGPTDRIEADDTEDATYTHEHLTIGVDVDKAPSGELPPGEVIPFTLTYTNTGDAPLNNPVFTDVLPTQGGENQLIFDPDSDPSINSPYEFELEGPAPVPASGAPLPTDQDEIGIAEAGNTITFTMPAGTVLEVGQTYTITIEMMLRPGLTPDDEIDNTATVISDEPFDADACTPTYRPLSGVCQDTTTIYPLRVAALSTVKKVKADIPVIHPDFPEIYLDRDVLPPGVEVDDDYCDGAEDAAGFYRAPCVPMTYPGDTETWRFTITNAGTIPIDTLVAADSLPHVGDQGLIVTLPRDSEWDPTFADGIQLVDGAGGTLTTFYSTDDQPCIDDLNPVGDPCPAGDWLPLDGSVDPEDVHSLKLVVGFPDANLFNPGEQVTLEFQTRTTPDELSDSTYPVAWNTVATGGASNDDGTRARVTATEGRKVGVTYPTGPIELQKVATGDGADYAPDTFDVQLECTVDGEDMTGLPVVTLPTNGDPVEVDGLPLGAVCTASETNQGQTTDSADSATVGAPSDPIGLVTVTNVFDLGDMTIEKAVETDAVDQDGNPIEYPGPFEVSAACEFLGEEVWGTDYAGSPMVLEIEDDETLRIEGLPVGAECTTTESDDADATDVDVDPGTVTIGGDDRDPDEVVSVTVTNTFSVGSLELTKVADGPGLANAPGLADGPFTLHVTCTLTDPSHPAPGEVVYDDDDVTITGVAPGNVVTIDNIATGAVCEVEETDDGGATDVVVDPDEVTIGDGTTADVTITNTFVTGSLAVTKEVDSDAVDEAGDPITYGPFEVAVACTFEGDAVYGDGYDAGDPMVDTIEDGETWQIDGLPIGSECTTTETDDAGAVTTDVVPGTVTIGDDSSGVEVVTVTNRFDDGSLHLVKEVEGDALDNNPAIGEGPFTLHVTCTLTDDSHPDGAVVYDADVVLEGEQPLEATIDDLATGAVCDVTETDEGGATDSVVSPGQVTIGDGTTVDVTATNTFEVADMSVAKVVESDAVDEDGNPIEYGPFEISVTCQLDGYPVVADGYTASPMVFEVEDGDVVALEDLPIGASCTTTEPDDADAVDVDITPATVTIGGDDADPTDVQAVTVTNGYDDGVLRLIKQATGPALANNPDLGAGPFTLHVRCTLTDATHAGDVVYEDDVVLSGYAPGNRATIGDIATGAVCTVTETDTGGATSNAVTPGQVTIGDDTTVEVTATNTFQTGAMRLAKDVDSDAVDQDGNPISYGPFQLSVTCTYEGRTVLGDGYTTSPMVRTIADGGVWRIDGLPVGASCTATEPDDADALSTDIVPGTVTIAGNGPAQVQRIQVTNHFGDGSLRLTKAVVGPALDNNPSIGEGPFTLNVRCTLTDASHAGTVVYDDDVVLSGYAPENVATIDDIATGAVCTVTEPGNGGATGTTISPNPVTIGDDTTVAVTATNDFEIGAMAVTKSVTSDAVDQDGDPIAYGPFQVSVTCRFQGRPVVADGYDSNPMLHTITDGGTWLLSGLPVGSRCDVTEPDSHDALEVDIAPASVVITDEVLPVRVAVENVYGDGSLHLRKLVAPEEVEDFPISEGPFTMHLTCTLTDASRPDGEIVWDDDIVLQGPQPLEVTVDNIAAGAVCIVTEPGPGAASVHVIVPRRVTIGDDTTVNVVATNLFGRGALTVTKTIDGAGADRYGAGPFEVSLTCTYTDVDGNEVELNTPGGPTRELSADNDYTATYDPLLFGSTCQIEETETAGANSSVITDADGNEVSEVTVDSLTEELQLEVTNTFEIGSVVVKKQVVGPGPDRFEIELACTQDVDDMETAIDIPGGAERALSAGDDFTTRYDDLPTGAECTLVETDDGGARSTTITPNSGDPEVGTLTVGDGTSVRLLVVNQFPDLGPGGDGTDPDDGDGLLPDTGAGRWLLALLIAGLALVVAGSGLILRGRRDA